MCTVFCSSGILRSVARQEFEQCSESLLGAADRRRDTHRKQRVWIWKTWRDAAVRFASGVRPPLTSTWFLTHHIPLHMSLIDVTYARSHPPGYLLWFHLRFLPLNSYHILMLTVLLTLSVPLWCLVLILSAPYLPGQPIPLLLPLGYLSFSANIVLNSGQQKGYGANHKILLTLIFIDHSSLT